MSINDWFKQREIRRYTVSEGASAEGLPDGVWRKCPDCSKTLYQGDVVKSHSVCPHCGHHFALIARDRIEALVDEGSFAETDADLTSLDPLRFTAAKPYDEHAYSDVLLPCSTGVIPAVSRMRPCA